MHACIGRSLLRDGRAHLAEAMLACGQVDSKARQACAALAQHDVQACSACISAPGAQRASCGAERCGLWPVACGVQVGSDSDPQATPVWPVLKALGSAPEWVGPVGTAAGVKLALNQLIGSLTVRALGPIWRASSPACAHACLGLCMLTPLHCCMHA